MSIIDRIRTEQFGFVQDIDLPEIIAHKPLQPLLVRCGNGRFVCPAQDLEHFTGIITREGTDYIRDVSLSAFV